MTDADAEAIAALGVVIRERFEEVEGEVIALRSRVEGLERELAQLRYAPRWRRGLDRR